MKTFNLTKRNEKGAEIIASCFNQKKKKGVWITNNKIIIFVGKVTNTKKQKREIQGKHTLRKHLKR
jgi:hypothetical protein